MMKMKKLPNDPSMKKITGIKEDVRDSYNFFQDCYSRYNEYKRFVLVHTLSDQDCALLEAMGFPSSEFNIIKPYCAALIGEVVEADPSVSISAENEADVHPEVIELVEQHSRHVVCAPDNIPRRKQILEDQVYGGRGVLEMVVDYAAPGTFRQTAKMERSEPELTGFDPMATESHKGDGEYCFKCFPMTIKEFKKKYPDVNVESIRFMRSEGGFSWSYREGKEKILILMDFYRKKKKHVTMYQLSNGEVVEEKEYNKQKKVWGEFYQMPQIVDKKEAEITKIMRYRCIESKILEEEETMFSILPLICVDGDTARIRKGDNGAVEEILKPFFYDAIGSQRFKNLAGNTVANSLQNIVNHKFMVAKEALPKEEEFLSAYKDTQTANVLVYNQFYENNPQQPIPNPIREVQKMPAPPEVLNSFIAADSLVQNTFGSHDSAQGRMNNNQLSGVAMVQASLSSSKSSMPFVQNYMFAIQRFFQEYVNLMPKLLVGKDMRIPVMDKNGERNFAQINQNPDQPDLQWENNMLNIRVEAGANFKVQKQMALEQIIALSGANQRVGEFFATKGLPFVFDNMTMRSADQIKEAAKEWMEEQKKMQEQQMQMQQQQMENNPLVIKNKISMAELQAKQQQHAQQAEIDKEKMHLEREKLAQQIVLEQKKAQIKLVEIKAAQEREDKRIKHDNFVGMAKLHHEVHQPKQQVKH